MSKTRNHVGNRFGDVKKMLKLYGDRKMRAAVRHTLQAGLKGADFDGIVLMDQKAAASNWRDWN